MHARGARAARRTLAGSMGVEGGKIEMLLDPAHARFEFADQDPVADDDRMIFDDGAAQAGDLVAELLARRLVLGVGPRLHRREVRSDVGAQGLHVGLQLGPEFAEFRFGRHLGANGRHVGANAAQQLKNEVFWFVGHGRPL